MKLDTVASLMRTAEQTGSQWVYSRQVGRNANSPNAVPMQLIASDGYNHTGLFPMMSPLTSGNNPMPLPGNSTPMRTPLVQKRINAMRKNRADASAQPFSARSTSIAAYDFFAGRIVVSSATRDQLFPGTTQTWSAYRGLTGFRNSWLMRRGVNPEGSDKRFWDWVLESVARPPVLLFTILLGVFAVTVGPISFVVASKLRRTYLILIAAPVLALLTTAAFLAYGLLSDGLGVQVRSHQMTWIDADSGKGMRHVRNTYFAGLQPSNDLRFPGDAAIYEYVAADGAGMTSDRSRRFEYPRRITIRDDEQRLESQFLPARRQRQFIHIRPIDISPADGGAQQRPLIRHNLSADEIQPRIQLNFPFRILRFMARDETGKYWEIMPPSGVNAEDRGWKEATDYLNLEPEKAVQLFHVAPKIAARVLQSDVSIPLEWQPPAGMRFEQTANRTNYSTYGSGWPVEMS
ncbi:MAG: hypothetical protein AAFN70_14190, partial [Planctomycetota bacterium]